jgi:pimeloyl-ACP methyl ester carboxylesterase
MPASMERHEQDAQRGGAELLDQIGPAILMTHSAGGPVGWLLLDARPEFVKAIIAVEPIGPPFAPAGNSRLSWGITATRIAYDPPIEDFAQFELEEREPGRPDTVACLVQKQPAHQLPNFADVPIVVVTAEASWMAADNHGIVDFLAQAGASVEHLRLEDKRIHGNGHAMMLETNSDEIAGVIAQWIEKQRLS